MDKILEILRQRLCRFPGLTWYMERRESGLMFFGEVLSGELVLIMPLRVRCDMHISSWILFMPPPGEDKGGEVHDINLNRKRSIYITRNKYSSNPPSTFLSTDTSIKPYHHPLRPRPPVTQQQEINSNRQTCSQERPDRPGNPGPFPTHFLNPSFTICMYSSPSTPSPSPHFLI